VMLPFIFSFWTAHAQERTITGTISSERNNDPVISATITNTRTKKSVQSSSNGAFIIKAQKGDVLQISSVGVTSKSITVEDQSTLTISLPIKGNW
jgi:hypothetical protein